MHIGKRVGGIVEKTVERIFGVQGVFARGRWVSVDLSGCVPVFQKYMFKGHVTVFVIVGVGVPKNTQM